MPEKKSTMYHICFTIENLETNQAKGQTLNMFFLHVNKVINLVGFHHHITQDCFIYIHLVQILVHSHFDLVSSPLALEATEPVSEMVTQMALEVINKQLISVQQKRQE